ncbi:LysR family transcriptional regulator [Nocardioides fonticola]|uniref:LysR family transcriptional regulator n=1 Tax=Nocardioides fonticola TaxID=450363 RepID=A0ABP7XEN0_9ACTN
MHEGLHAVDANLLPVLLTLLEERSVVRTAERLSMSPQAVGSALARLRRHFDDPLLVRVGRHLELTTLAATLLPHVTAAVTAAAALLGDDVGFDPATSTKQFTISMSEYAMTVLTAPLLRRLRDLAPGCTLRVETLPAAATEHWDGALLRCDLLVGPEHEAHPGRARPVFREDLVCIVPAAHPAAAAGVLTREALAAMPRAVVPGEHLPLAPDRRPLLASSLLSLPHLVVAADAWALVPRRLAERAGALIAVVETPFPACALVASAMWHARREQDPSGRWLRGVLAEVGASLETAAEIGAGAGSGIGRPGVAPVLAGTVPGS